MNIYDEIGVKKIINTLGNSTVLGGNTPSGEVKDAIESASNNYVSMQELTDTCRKLVADLIGSESALITPGAASALTLATAGAMTGTDRTLIEQIPDTTGMKNEVIIQTQLRVPYDKAIEVAGAKLIEVGSPEKTSIEHITNAINNNTLAIHYLPGGESVASSGKHTNALDIETVIKIAKDNNIYVIVDAAGQVYPTDNLTKYIKMGADAVAYGAKYFGALNGTGILVGKSEIIEAARLHSFIGFEFEKLRSIGRSMKMDKEDVIAVYVALKQWMTMNHEERIEIAEKKALLLKDKISSVSNISISEPDISGTTIGLKITLNENCPFNADQLSEKLASGNPSIWARGDDNTSVIFRMGTVNEEDLDIVADKLKEILN